jgi:hypothetical protein
MNFSFLIIFSLLLSILFILCDLEREKGEQKAKGIACNLCAFPVREIYEPGMG